MGMTETLREQFRARLFSVARERHRRAAAALADGDAEAVRAQLHALAGEAHMLGEEAMAAAAVDGERAALDWRTGAESDRPRIAEALARLAAVLDAESDHSISSETS